MNIYRINIQKLLTSVDLPNRKIPYLNEYSGNPKQIASYVRQHWKIPKGPIDNLTKIVEDNGVIVIPIEFPTDKIDGRSMTTEKGDCIIFLNKKLSGDRARYTLAHELGHVIMHLYLPPTAVLNIDDDGEANLFASEFLMPENEIKQHLNGKLTIEKLADLKRIWKTSMQAILVWAERLGKITPRNARFIWQQFGSMGIRLKEPIEIPKEYPTLLREIIDAYTHQLSFTKEDLAEMLCLLPDEFSENFLPQQITLRVERLFSRQ
jgi:Zn-dependent peptidase ImmA (M78 family)